MRPALVLVALVTASAYVVTCQLGEHEPGGRLAVDVFAYFYPNILYALRSLAAGGHGLLWNPLQNCGQPFFATTSTGLLYPGNLLFLVLDSQTALRGLLLTNLVIGGLGAYGLGRELGLTAIGALAAGLAFILGNVAYHATIWMPTVQAPYMWMPVALWLCERLMKAPCLRDAMLLGAVLAVALLPGHPQFVFFTCQLIVLRLVWGLFDGTERRRLPRALGAVGLAFVVMLLLTAVQYLPGLEVAAESVRSRSLTPGEIAPREAITLGGMLRNVCSDGPQAPFSLVPGFLVLAAVVSPRRRAALFYLLAGVLFLVLAAGDSTGLGRLYLASPVGQLFREPLRMLFVTAFCSAVLVGLAVDVLARGSWSALAVAGVTLAGLYAWSGSLRPMDWCLAGAVLGGGVLTTAAPAGRPLGVAVLLGVVGLAAVLMPHRSTLRYLADDRPLLVHEAVFAGLRARLTPQDRVHLVEGPPEPGFVDKTATLFGVRATTDYEPQATRRYAEFTMMLQNGMLPRNLNEVYFPGPWDARRVQWPLLHLAAVRYLLIPASLDEAGSVPGTPVAGDETIHVYENPRALPRAYYVPQVSILADGRARLLRLAMTNFDPRQMAFVDAAPASGFRGMSGNRAQAEVRFVVDDPERVVLEAVAPARGFVFLADQYFPGWSATVNDRATPIQVGNHAFRLVEVPAGPVRVEFRYRPRLVWIGALISGVTLLAVGLLLTSPAAARRRPSQ